MERQELDSATVRDYLPVLVDKAVRQLLDPEEPVRRRRPERQQGGSTAVS